MSATSAAHVLALLRTAQQSEAAHPERGGAPLHAQRAANLALPIWRKQVVDWLQEVRFVVVRAPRGAALAQCARACPALCAPARARFLTDARGGPSARGVRARARAPRAPRLAARDCNTAPAAPTPPPRPPPSAAPRARGVVEPSARPPGRSGGLGGAAPPPRRPRHSLSPPPPPRPLPPRPPSPVRAGQHRVQPGCGHGRHVRRAA